MSSKLNKRLSFDKSSSGGSIVNVIIKRSIYLSYQYRVLTQSLAEFNVNVHCSILTLKKNKINCHDEKKVTKDLSRYIAKMISRIENSHRELR